MEMSVIPLDFISKLMHRRKRMAVIQIVKEVLMGTNLYYILDRIYLSTFVAYNFGSSESF